ncbi:MAG: ATP synthase F0 subunit B, partial [Pseudomonadota bacterium]
MTRSILAVGAALTIAPFAVAASDGHGSGGPFEWLTHPATNVAFAAMVLFLLIVWRLGGFKAILGVLDNRAATIEAQLNEAKDLREAAAKMLADAERSQKQADADAKSIVEQAKKDAKAMREDART